MTREISNNDDVIDSREVNERITELQESTDELSQDERTELATLLALAQQGATIDDWQYGATLIRDSHFVDYARELAEDLGAISPNAEWPLSYIDWDAAADALQSDYTNVEFDRVTYWVR